MFINFMEVPNMSSSSKAGQRILSVLDENSFVEIGALVTARSTDFNQKPEKAASDGVITGYGTIDGSLVFIYSQDSEVLGGSVGEMHAKKIANIYELAIGSGAPVIGLLDSTGLRLQEATDALNAFGILYAEAAKASGVIPQITAVFGSCGGGLSVLNSLADFSFMAEDAKLFVSAPNTLAGNKEDKNDTAKAAVKAAAGSVDEVAAESDILAKIRALVSYLPSNNEDDASIECADDLNREVASFAANLADPAAALIDLADNGIVFETRKDYAKEMVTAFIKLNGSTVGVVANRSKVYDENAEVAESFDTVLTRNGAYKAVKFIEFCDAFEIPVVTLTNVTGFDATVDGEKGLDIAVAKLAAAFADATVPKVNVIVGSAVGSAYTVMNSKALGADLTIAVPEAKVALMDAKLAAQIIGDGKSADEIAEIQKNYAELQNSIDSAAAHGYIDQIAPAADLRKYLIGALEMLYTKRVDRPAKKHKAL